MGGDVRDTMFVCGVEVLRAEAVEGAAGTLESVDDVERGDSLALRVLSVCDGVPDDLRMIHEQSKRPDAEEDSRSQGTASEHHVSPHR